MRRGFTLLEVVAATVLLTLIVGTSIPFVRNARVDLRVSAAPELRVSELNALNAAIDDLMRQQPNLIRDCLGQPAGYSVEWISNEETCSAIICTGPVVQSADDEHRSTHVWAVFRMDGVELARWMRAPSETHERGDAP